MSDFIISSCKMQHCCSGLHMHVWGENCSYAELSKWIDVWQPSRVMNIMLYVNYVHIQRKKCLIVSKLQDREAHTRA